MGCNAGSGRLVTPQSLDRTQASGINKSSQSLMLQGKATMWLWLKREAPWSTATRMQAGNWSPWLGCLGESVSCWKIWNTWWPQVTWLHWWFIPAHPQDVVLKLYLYIGNLYIGQLYLYLGYLSFRLYIFELEPFTTHTISKPICIDYYSVLCLTALDRFFVVFVFSVMIGGVMAQALITRTQMQSGK